MHNIFFSTLKNVLPILNEFQIHFCNGIDFSLHTHSLIRDIQTLTVCESSWRKGLPFKPSAPLHTLSTQLNYSG